MSLPLRMVREYAVSANSRVSLSKLRRETLPIEKRTLLSLALRHRLKSRRAGCGTERVRRLVFSS